jgi:hypothetical protein
LAPTVVGGLIVEGAALLLAEAVEGVGLEGVAEVRDVRAGDVPDALTEAHRSDYGASL